MLGDWEICSVCGKWVEEGVHDSLLELDEFKSEVPISALFYGLMDSDITT